MDIGQAVRTLRLQQGLSQTQLGERIGMSAMSVSNFETGKSYPPKGSIERICSAFGIPTSYLALAAIEEQDIPEEKRMLYRVLLPLRNELLDNGTVPGKPAAEKQP